MKKIYKFAIIVIVIAIINLVVCGVIFFRVSKVETMIDNSEVVEIEEIPIYDGWIEENGKWFYLDESTGEKTKGWATIDEKEYFFNPLNGIRWEGLLKLSDNEMYYFDKEGVLLKDCITEQYVIGESGKIERIFLTQEEQEERKIELQTNVDEILAKYGAISAGIALIENGEVTNTWEYGDAVKDSVAMTQDTKIRIASISKVIIGMNIFKAAEEGVLDIDESIGTYWGFPIANPEYPDIPITLRTILTHTSSIADAEGYKNIEDRLKRNSVFRSVKPSSGSAYSYCNYAFAVGGTTLEKAANKTIYDISEEYFFEPMGIDASFAGGRLENSDLLASLYYAGGKMARSKETMAGFMGHENPGEDGSFMPGGLCISAKDLAKLICILVNDGSYQGQRYLTEESVATIETEYCPADLHGAEVTQCLPLKYRTDIYGEDRLYFHTGSAYGAYTLFSYNPDTKNGVIVLTIGASGVCDENGIYAVCGDISELLYQDAGKYIIDEL